MMNISSIFYEIAIRWMPQHLTDLPLWARGPQRLGWEAELTHTATGEW